MGARSTDWLPALFALAIGLVVGAAFAWRSVMAKRERAAASGGDFTDGLDVLNRADLMVRKNELINQLRELDDMGGVETEAKADERMRLEAEAARVFQQISERRQAEAKSSGDVSETLRSDSESARGGSRLSPETRGALKGGFVVAVAAGIIFAFVRGAAPPKPGQQTGMSPPTASSSFSPADEANSNQPGAGPKPIVPKETPRLAAARTELQKSPESLSALVEFGFASAEAGGWIDLYRVANEILRRDPQSVDGRLQLGLVKIAMGQFDDADKLLLEASEIDSKDTRVIELRSRLADVRARNPQKAAPPHQDSKPISPGAPGSPSASSSKLSGSISIEQGTIVPSQAVVFLIARAPGIDSGPPLLVKRIDLARFPMAFELGAEDAMLKRPLPDKFQVTVRVDQDGNPMTKTPGDLTGASSAPVAFGAKDIQIQLSQIN